ncbi:amino acid permease family protein, partial [Vibrio parahaemolyticus V-223/04]
HRTTISCPWR